MCCSMTDRGELYDWAEWPVWPNQNFRQSWDDSLTLREWNKQEGIDPLFAVRERLHSFRTPRHWELDERVDL